MKGTPRKPRRQRGFTLIELLVVLTILSVVSAVGTTAFVTVTAAWNEARAMTELDRQAEDVFQAIRKDVNALISHDLSGLSLTSESGEIEDDRKFPVIQLEDDRVSLPVRASEVSQSLEVAARVGYHVDRSGESRLVRTIGPAAAEFPKTGRQDLTPRARVLGFNVEYLARTPGAGWVREWTRTEPPAALRVSVSMEDTDRSDFQIARKVVIPVKTR